MSDMLRIGAAFCVCGFAGHSFAAQMTGAEIRSSIIGHELCTPKSGGLFADLVFCFTYGRDGLFKFSKGDPGEATRWVFDNDQVCLFKASSPKDKSCASFERINDKRFKVNGKDNICLGACED